MAKPIVGHLDPFFFEVVQDIQKLLAKVFGTENPFTFSISGTGSAGMEAAVANFVEPGAKFAVLANGFFCDRISEMARRNGAQVVRLEKPWGEVFCPEEAQSFIQREKPAMVAYVHAETSTGAMQVGNAICNAAHEAGALVIADAVTSLGGMPVMVDKTGIDIAYSCTQKALSCVPGLAPITLSAKALEKLRARKSAPATWYLDLKLLDEYYDGAHRYHHTAPISLFYALREALLTIEEEGLENRWKRHLQAHLGLVAGLEAMGLKMHVADGNRLWTLNTPVVPEGIDDLKVRKRLMQEHGIEVLGGFGPLAGKVFRIGLMGPLATQENVLFFLTAFEGALRAEGYQPKESGTAAAEDFFATASAR
jgi:alanine-glyoxylate transaminase/serine-glyoxylate transaminase/serine-pyruvate transaminase